MTTTIPTMRAPRRCAHRGRSDRVLLALVGVTAFLAAFIATGLAATPVQAQTATTSTTTESPAPESDYAKSDTANNVGTVVGGAAVMVIIVGAGVLYLRNRRPTGRAPDQGSAP